MKKRTLITTLIIVLGIILLVLGVILGYDKDVEVKPPKDNDEQQVHPDYHELGPQSLKNDQVFDNIKYTQNHLSTTSNTYATFTSVVFNETGVDIIRQTIEIDFYDINNNLIATMVSTIENLKVNESTVIYAIVEKDLSTANTFKVRKVN